MLTIKQIISLITTYETEIVILVTAIIGLFLFVKNRLWLLLLFIVSINIVYMDQLITFIAKFRQLFQ